MANVFFKRGHQADLDTLVSNVANSVGNAAFVEGSFYLTDDTNRLYFAQSSSNLVDLNQYIHFVATRANLPTAAGATLKNGDIYYIQGENILCIYQSNQNPPWVQINPDTKLADDQNAIISVDSDTNEASIGITVADSIGTTATGDFTIVGGENVHISVSGNTITISSDDENDNTTYQLQTPTQTTKGQIKLHSSAANDDTIVDIVGDGDNVNVTSATVNGVPTVSITGNAGVTGIVDGFDENGEYTITLTRTSGGDIETDGVTPTIQYGVAVGEKENATFVNGTASLDVYTKDEIDDLLEAQEAQLDAMKYAGTISSSADAATKLVSAPVYGIGTVYKAGVDFTLSSPAVTAKLGDLIIAGGNSDTAVTWDVVPSGNDQLLSISGNDAENIVVFHDGVSNSTVGSITIDGGRKNSNAANAEIEVVTTVSGDDDEETTFTVVHGAPGTGTAVNVPAATGAAVQSAGTSGTPSNITIPVITGISKDAQGHITAVSAQNYQITDTHAVLQPIITTVEAEDDAATVSMNFQLDSATAEETGFTISSDNLSITTNASDDIVVNLEWGTF